MSVSEATLSCTMWIPLLLICASTAAAVPIDPTQVPSAPSTGNVTVLNDGHTHSAQTEIKGAVTSNDTSHVTPPPPAAGESVSIQPPQTNNSETLTELEDDLVVQEGDILMQDDRNALYNLWPDAVINYLISQETADREQDIDEAMSMISNVTCLRFRKHTTQLNYLRIRRGRGCASFVGCQGGAQSSFFAPSCSVGNLCHELIHAAGFHHEHTRQDRDQYVSVKWTSIMPGKQNNFKVKQGDTLNLPYDINSIMHYGPYFFSQSGSATLSAKSGGEHMGQRSYLSSLDAQKLNSLYHCAERMAERMKAVSPAEHLINS